MTHRVCQRYLRSLYLKHERDFRVSKSSLVIFVFRALCSSIFIRVFVVAFIIDRGDGLKKIHAYFR